MADHLPQDLQRLNSAMADALAEGRCGDPFAVLGPHAGHTGRIVRVFLPGAVQVEVSARDGRTAWSVVAG